MLVVPMKTGHSSAIGQLRCNHAASHGSRTRGTADDVNMNDREAIQRRVDVTWNYMADFA